MYEVYKRSEPTRILASYKTREDARASVDRRDNEYGCYAFAFRKAGSTSPSY